MAARLPYVYRTGNDKSPIESIQASGAISTSCFLMLSKHLGASHVYLQWRVIKLTGGCHIMSEPFAHVDLWTTNKILATDVCVPWFGRVEFVGETVSDGGLRNCTRV